MPFQLAAAMVQFAEQSRHELVHCMMAAAADCPEAQRLLAQHIEAAVSVPAPEATTTPPRDLEKWLSPSKN